MKRQDISASVLGFLAAQQSDTLWTVADIEKAMGIDRYDVSRALGEASDDGIVDRYPPTDARPAAYAMGEDQRRRFAAKGGAR